MLITSVALSGLACSNLFLVDSNPTQQPRRRGRRGGPHPGYCFGRGQAEPARRCESGAGQRRSVVVVVVPASSPGAVSEPWRRLRSQPEESGLTGSGGGHRDPPEARLPRAPSAPLPRRPRPFSSLARSSSLFPAAGCAMALALAALAAVEPACGNGYQQVSNESLPGPGPRTPIPWPCPARRPLQAAPARPVANSTPRLGRPRWAWTGRSGPGLGFEAAAGRTGPSAISGGGKTSACRVSSISHGGRVPESEPATLRRQRPGDTRFSFFHL